MDPKFNTARGAATLTTAPPFDFSGVVMRTFSLKARMWALRQFCHRYLNVAPEIAEFEPAMPFVQMQMLSYGKMSTEVAAGGWVSQHELLFSIPVFWYRIEGGQRVLHDIGTVTPYVFVDEQSSQAVGREVYGWPKVLGWLDSGVSAWVKSPREPLDLVVLSTMVMPEQGSPEPRRLVEIRRHPRPAIADVPPEWDDPLNPFATVPQAVSGGLSLGVDLLEMLTALPIRGYEPDPGTVQQALARFFSQAPMAERPAFNTINLKQFRAAADPSLACYQSITNAQMTLTSFNRGGLLGEARQLQGDLSGGYRVRIFRYPSQPLVETLGLEVAEEHDDMAEAPFAEFEPLTPFWVDVDFLYGKGEEICWRGGDGIWHQGKKALPPSEPAGPTLYNTARGGVGETFGGPFSFPDATLRVLPLMADHDVLQVFVDLYLNQLGEGKAGQLPSETSFKVWGSYVYLVVASHEATALGSENLRLGLQRAASFIIPILCYEGERLASTAILRAYMYVDSDAAAITSQEVQGWPSSLASLVSPADPWMDASGPAITNRNLLEIETDLLQSLGLGQRARRRLLVEIGAKPIFPEADQPAWEAIAADWGERLLSELERMGSIRSNNSGEFVDALAMALDPLALGRPILDVALRQFRDVHKPERACYQGVSLSRTVLDDVSDVREIEGLMHVGIHRYASAPIVETLGLVVKASQPTESGMVDWLQPIRPFWMRLGMKTLLGQDIFFRVHTEQWTLAPEPLAAASRPGFEVGPGLVDYIDEDQFRKRHLAEAVELWRGAPVDDAAKAIQTIEPQMIIEGLLSRGWGNRGLPLFWRREKDRERQRPVPDFCVPSRSLGPFGERFQELHPELKTLQGYWYLDAPLAEPAGRESGARRGEGKKPA